MNRRSLQFSSGVDLDDPAAWMYPLPEELIAQRPLPNRDDARLMVVDRAAGRISHQRIRDLPQFLQPGDLLVFNNTRVLPARLFGHRTATGGKWEGLFLGELREGIWHLIGETRGRLQPGESLTIHRAHRATNAAPRDSAAHRSDVCDMETPVLELTLLERAEEGSWLARPVDPRRALELLEEFGSLPLPPYLHRRLADADDETRYQTCFASRPGAIAAPTAGLHFTPALLEQCRAVPATTAEVTLHVGIGTFRPVKAARISEHRMHQEWCELSADCCHRISSVRQSGARVIAVGTTTVRTLESAARNAETELQPWCGHTDLFIRPPFPFRQTDGLLTNFHLPGSTLLIMIAALAGYELVMDAYRQAVDQRYRFFSYGDAMLII